MDGEAYTPDARPQDQRIDQAASTPVSRREGHTAGLDLVALSSYKINIRSFHPNPQFEPGGFRFEGDDRGFSLGPSYFGDPAPSGSVTSRIWQRYTLDLARDQTNGDLVENSELEQQCNSSAPGPGAWSIFGSEETYEADEFKPHGTLTDIPYIDQTAIRNIATQHFVARRTWYGGENYAFRSARTQRRVSGTTVVPSLETFSELHVRLERVTGYMDIVSLVYGDGFPNCEAFIEDTAGNKLMLGTHVRIGLPSTHLAGTNRRLFWANALRVRVDKQGCFQQQLGLFSRIAGGPPSLRDKHPILSIDEFRSRSDQPRYIGTVGFYTIWWNFSRPADIAQRDAAAIRREPIRLSVFCNLDDLRSQLTQVWKDGRHFRTTVQNWNDWNLYRNPNGGRSPDSYDLAPERWQRP